MTPRKGRPGTRRTGWTAAAVGLVLVTGCGGETASSAAVTSPASSPASFGQQAVQRDLDGAVAAAGLPGGEVRAGFTGTERTRADLAARLAPCVVSWSSSGARGEADDVLLRRWNAVLAQLTARGWEETSAPEEAALSGGGSYAMATLRKQGWVLNARHTRARGYVRSTATVTEEACFERLTGEEAALPER